MDDLANSTWRKLRNQAEREKQIGIVAGANVEAGTHVIDADDGQVIRSDHPNPVHELRFGGPDAVMMGFMETCQQKASYLGGNLDVIGGFAPGADTLGQIDFMQDRVISATTKVMEHIAWYFLDDDELVIPKLVRPFSAVPGESYNMIYPDPEFNSSFADFAYNIEPFSMQQQSPSERLTALRSIWQQDILANPLLMQQGIMPNVQAYLKFVAKNGNWPELLEFVDFVEPVMADSVNSSAPRQAPHTVRENVRHNAQDNPPGMGSGDISALLQSAAGEQQR